MAKRPKQAAKQEPIESYEVPTVSPHVHGRIDAHTIIEASRKRNRNGRIAVRVIDHLRDEVMKVLRVE